MSESMGGFYYEQKTGHLMNAGGEYVSLEQLDAMQIRTTALEQKLSAAEQEINTYKLMSNAFTYKEKCEQLEQIERELVDMLRRTRSFIACYGLAKRSFVAEIDKAIANSSGAGKAGMEAVDVVCEHCLGVQKVVIPYKHFPKCRICGNEIKSAAPLRDAPDYKPDAGVGK